MSDLFAILLYSLLQKVIVFKLLLMATIDASNLFVPSLEVFGRHSGH